MTDLLPADLVTLVLDATRVGAFMAGMAFTVALVHRAHTAATRTYKSTAQFEQDSHKKTRAELDAVRAVLLKRDKDLARCRLDLGRALVDRSALLARVELAARLMADAGLDVELISGPLPSMTDQPQINGGHPDD